ncbi:MAG: D-aminoacylase [Nisaea sp.]|uniref:N-acyl-D-amino-acid deacylase family protein n=1 Tax=Nisaea sp. TaxID=2024842 RepID=UPI001B22C4BD|nr:D-aminoacylase [Nisaea sp.]MBO6561224.1 D-aminoacylase [Nisaea sp.]
MAAAAYDIVLEGGDVVDGTGGPRRRADVGIRDEKIAAVGDLSGAEAGKRVDVSNRIVAPGFIDVHTHDDRMLLSQPDFDAKVSQGVTTVVVGNCGISLAPLVLDVAPPPPLDLIGDPDWYKFRTFDSFLSAVEQAPASVNAAFLVGHSTLRVGTMDRLDRAATGQEIKQMRGLLEEALDSGAVGFSTGLFYAPSHKAPTEEVIELSRSLKAFGARYVTHMRNESNEIMDSLEETFTIGREADCPVIVSHHKVQGKHNFGRSCETLACFEKHMHHQDIGLDIYPYCASSTVLKPDSIALSERVKITWSKARPDLAGRDLADIAKELGCDIYEAAEQLQPAGAIYFSMSEEDVQRILKFEHAMIGSDGLPHDEFPHPRLWGTFPRVLGHYCRDLELFPLEEAVRRMTGLSAQKFGLKGRGTVAEGNYADLCVFDEKTVIDRADFDHPTAPAGGIESVFVNGRMVWGGGAHTGARPGRALRRGATLAA